MLIYEVNLTVDGDAAEAMAVWMKAHVREMLEFDGLEGATWYFLDPAEDRQRWSIQYQVDSWQHLNDYFDNHAETMRQDGLRRFGGTFSVDRRVLYERERFER